MGWVKRDPRAEHATFRQVAPMIWAEPDPEPERWTWRRLAREALALCFFAALGAFILWCLLTPAGMVR